MRTAQVYEEDEATTTDSEFSLGMGSLIGIFFGLALVCGVFFGFGYMMGHRAPGPYVPAEPLYDSPKPAATTVAPKPSAQMPEQPENASRVVLPTATPGNSAEPIASAPTNGATSKSTSAAASTPASPSVPKAQPVPQAETSAPPPTAPAGVQPTSGSIMVQIAAVKNRPDAEALANALRKNGFTPTIRTEPQDKLLHVQVGPFASRDDAKAMRQKLSSAGYDAFIK